jgi:hypothetical protein
MKHAKHLLPGNHLALLLVACCKVNQSIMFVKLSYKQVNPGADT